ncbi:MAG TPA: FecR domain-containing protein [Candidatus Sulfotelmatobacter sp.]|nr:FecR domain-containing protein [Candidatus Sulfotelmatobacter sp.]
MKPLEQLLVEWGAGTLSAEDLAELKQRLATPQARTELVDDWLLDEAIYHALRSQPTAAAAAAQTQAGHSHRQPAAKSASVRQRLFPWLVWRELHLSFRWSLLGVAAAACLAVVGSLLYFQKAAVGQLAAAQAQVVVEHAGKKIPAQPGLRLYPGDRIRVPPAGAATIAWDDESTTVELAANTELRLLNPLRGKQLSLPSGSLQASVASQPRWRPLTILTPQAQATVLGTHFSLSVTGTATRLDVLEGAVRLRKTHRTAVDNPPEVIVHGGETAQAAPGAKLAVEFLTGFLSSEVWTVPPGTPLTEAPARGTLVNGPATSGSTANCVERLRGYLLAPASGNFTFWITTIDGTPAELWLSPDANPVHKQRLAYVSPRGAARQSPPRSLNSTSALSADWQRSPSQQSAPQNLVQNRRYYLEVWHQGVGIGSLALGWLQPGDPASAQPKMVDLQSLCPFGEGPEPGTRTGNKEATQ